MHTLLALGVTILTATTPQVARPPALPARPMTFTFIERVTFEEAMTAFANLSQMTLEFDQTVSGDVRRSAIGQTITMRDVTLDEAIGFLATQKGLSYRVEGKTIVIFKKP
jgi:hypothetical protein